MSGQNPREIAARVLGHTGREGSVAPFMFVETLLERELAHAGLKDPDRRLCQELVYGTVRWQRTLDWLIGRKTQGRVQKTGLQNLLRLGLYQIFFLDRIPNHAAVNETVELAKRLGFGAQAGFVNALLRGYLREFQPTKAALEDLKRTQPALGHSHPEWLVERWQKRWGIEPTNRLLAWNNTPPELFARVNTLKNDAGKLLEQWRAENVDYDFVRHDWLEENLVFRLKAAPPLERLPSFQAGKFYVQDPSTLLAVREVGARAGEDILDLCAAPGGKLTCLAQMMGNAGRLIAHDVSAERLKIVTENCARLGVTCATTSLPSTMFAHVGTGFDRVLLDAPCSNTGVMRRRVELRWRLEPKEMERLRQGQLDLLRQAGSLVRPGGTVVYSTCSLEPEENRGVVEEFLHGHGQFGLERERELRPFVEGVDGAYVATIKRAHR